MVQNCQIEFTNVKIPESQMMPGASNYKTGVEATLQHSRIIVIWNTVGGCIGVFKAALRNVQSRPRNLPGFELVQ
jgi:alkylation response protein AidB-like acyl-CoA dehydrogenase